MSYSLRNTYFIAAFWAVILILGSYYVLGFQYKKQKLLDGDNHAKRIRLQDLQLLEKDRSDLQLYCERLKDISLGKVGTLASQESPGETYDYILREMRKRESNLVINFNFRTQDTFLTLARKHYEVNGHGRFVDFYHLLWFLENGPLFYDVFELKMEPFQTEGQIKRPDDVSYELSVYGFNRDEGPDIRGISQEREAPRLIADIVRNRPGRLYVEPSTAQPSEQGNNQLMVATIRPNAPVYENLPSILAITPNVVICKEASGKTVRLRKGDSYLGGKVRTIDAQTGKMEIVIDQGAANQRVLTLTTAKN